MYVFVCYYDLHSMKHPNIFNKLALNILYANNDLYAAKLHLYDMASVFKYPSSSTV
jgi:hypothetical protein